MTVHIETDLESLKDEVGEWSESKFGVPPHRGGTGSPPNHPMVGIGEELGELTRSVLKRAQGIDDGERYAERDDVGPDAERDAIGDVAIYALDLWYRTPGSASSVDERIEMLASGYGELEFDSRIDAVKTLYSEYGVLSRYDPTLVDSSDDGAVIFYDTVAGLLYVLSEVASFLGHDVDECIEDAWGDVSER